jgi:GNAT superfamily N-acetyltransferase
VPAGFTSIGPLAAEHELDDFDCGTHALNHWLRTWARHSHREGSARTFVVCAEGRRRVVGFHSLSAASASREETPRKVARPLAPGLPVPLVLLARLAVDQAFHERGLGRALMGDAFVRTLRAADQVGAVAMVVHAKDDDAVSFYERWGFLPSPLQPLQLFLPLKTIRKATLTVEGGEDHALATGT